MAEIKGLIPPKEAKKLSDAYAPRFELISKSIGKEDNRSSWWSLDDIRAYLDYAEKQARELGYEMNGIRVYCGAHGEDGLSTSFIVPTARLIDGKDGGGGNADIPQGDGLNDGENGWPPGAGYLQQ
jgi:hypothetical protein